MTPQQTLILQWAVTIGIGIVIIGLVKYIFRQERDRLMSKEDHHAYCEQAKDSVRDGIKEEFATFKEHFDLEMENKVLRNLKNLNGTLEQKIADVVSTQVAVLSKALTEEINRKLDLVEVLKRVVMVKDKI